MGSSGALEKATTFFEDCIAYCKAHPFMLAVIVALTVALIAVIIVIACVAAKSKKKKAQAQTETNRTAEENSQRELREQVAEAEADKPEIITSDAPILSQPVQAAEQAEEQSEDVETTDSVETVEDTENAEYRDIREIREEGVPVEEETEEPAKDTALAEPAQTSAEAFEKSEETELVATTEEPAPAEEFTPAEEEKTEPVCPPAAETTEVAEVAENVSVSEENLEEKLEEKPEEKAPVKKKTVKKERKVSKVKDEATVVAPAPKPTSAPAPTPAPAPVESEKSTKYAGKWVVCRLIVQEEGKTEGSEEEMYFFELHASNGEKLLSSEEYTSYSGAVKGIETHKTNIARNNFRISLSKKGYYIFKLLTGKGTLLCTGENYPTKARCERAIESTKRFAETAILDENIQEQIIRVPAEEDSAIAPLSDGYNGKWVIDCSDGADGEKVYFFELFANNGEKLLTSEEYTTYIGAVNGIDTHKKNIESGNFRITITKRGDYIYKLLNSNGQLLCLGEHYKTRRLCQNAVESVKRFSRHSPMLASSSLKK